MRPGRHGETDDSEAVREHLQHVYWIGGGSGAGKSTVARRIAAQHSLQLYVTDKAMSEHARRSTPEECPYLRQFMHLDLDERWVNRSPRTMLDTFHWFRGEGFSMIVDDLLRLPRESRVIVEGLRVLPRLVKPLLAVPGHAVWLLPTPEFRQAVFDGRGGTTWSFLGETSDAERALRNLLERDRMFTDRLCEETKRLDLPAMEVDTTLTEDELFERVTEAFGL